MTHTSMPCFPLQYRAQTAGGDGEETFQRPVMVHRAMLGSVERMAAVLTEHWGGKWPFWLSPRQSIVVPVDPKFADYAFEVQQKIHDAGFYVDVDDSSRTLPKKVREGQVQQYNFILVVGEKEMDSQSVCVRARDVEAQETITLDELLERFKGYSENYTNN